MSKNSPRSSAARRNAEALLTTARKRELDFKLEQAKTQKKQEKLKRLEEETAKRKAARGDVPDAEKNQKDA